MGEAKGGWGRGAMLLTIIAIMIFEFRVFAAQNGAAAQRRARGIGY